MPLTPGGLQASWSQAQPTLCERQGTRAAKVLYKGSDSHSHVHLQAANYNVKAVLAETPSKCLCKEVTRYATADFNIHTTACLMFLKGINVR